MRSPLLTILALCPALPAQGPIPPAEGVQAAFDAWLEQFDAGNRLSGVVLVAREGEVVLHHAFGYADLEHGVENTVDTRFCVASINKVLTAAVLGQMVREGKLELQEPVGEWTPELPRGGEMTVQQLARHQAGIPHRVTTRLEETLASSARSMVDRVAEAELLFDPGQRSAYSSAGYTMLARVLELADERPFADVLQARIFTPAGMTDSFDPDGRHLLAHRARPYVAGRGAALHAVAKDMSFLVGAGSLVCTVRDLYRFYGALGDGRVSGRSLESGGATWTGASNGYFAQISFDAAGEQVVVFATNLWGGASALLPQALPQLLEGEVPPLETRPVVDHRLPPDQLRKLAGLFDGGRGFVHEVRVLDDELTFYGSVLLPQPDGSFFYTPRWQRVAFETDDAGRATALTLAGRTHPRLGDEYEVTLR